ncbi:hypothetical protein BJ875DRAFT_43701 [Amylocarpus encephaloides]|uniref:Uncharacterized protein n=1 Tax=Amylocarpus encephaloides TaxID=45428 RepID=A0A9P7YGI1_9HELO|nr:hypothetical protein BJ875DRAFT_43701 [Amylocarpus encephaloides]
MWLSIRHVGCAVVGLSALTSPSSSTPTNPIDLAKRDNNFGLQNNHHDHDYDLPTTPCYSRHCNMAFHYANFPSSTSLPKPDSKGDVTIPVTSITDIWRKPGIDSFNAPIIYKKIPISSFKSARVTATGAWKTLYDQGGLFLLFPSTKSTPTPKRRWVKAGIEFYDAKPRFSVVATDLWSDWSLRPLGAADEKAGKMTVVAEREVMPDGSKGPTLNVYLVNGDGTREYVRETSWGFWDLDEREEMWVGMAGAAPTESDVQVLDVKFSGFEIETWDGEAEE